MSELIILIRTRRRNKYYIVKGFNIFSVFYVSGFKKFKVIGWKYSDKAKELIYNVFYINEFGIPLTPIMKCKLL